MDKKEWMCSKFWRYTVVPNKIKWDDCRLNALTVICWLFPRIMWQEMVGETFALAQWCARYKMCVQIQNGYDFFCFFAYFFPSYVYWRNIHSAVSIIAYIRSQQLLFALNCSKKHFLYWLSTWLLCLERIALSSKTLGFRRSIFRLVMGEKTNHAGIASVGAVVSTEE